MNILNNSVYKVTIWALVFLLTIIAILDYYIRPKFGDILVEGHGLIFDIILFGLIIKFYEWLFQKKEREQKEQEKKQEKIQKCLDEVEDFAPWESEEAKYRIYGSIRRLNKLGVSTIHIDTCDLSGLKKLSELNLEASKISRVILNNTEVDIGNMTKFQEQSKFIVNGSKLEYVNFEGSSIEFSGSTTNFVGCNFFESKISGKLDLVDMSPYIFAETKCKELKTHLKNTSIDDSEIEKQRIKNKFHSANLKDVIFSGVVLTEVSFENATIINSDFVSKLIKRGPLMELLLLNEQLYVSIDEKELKLEDEFGRLSIRSKLNNTNFREATLENVSFEEADLSGADFEKAILINCNFKDAILKDAIFDKNFEETLRNQNSKVSKTHFV